MGGRGCNMLKRGLRQGSRLVCAQGSQALRRRCTTQAGIKAEIPPPSSGLIGNMVCGLALFGTVGGATKFLLDFPEPCQLALQVAEKDEVVEELLGKPFKRQLWWGGHITPSTAQVRIKLDGSKTSATLVGNIVFVPPVPEAAPVWQPLLLELHHLDDMNRLRVINLLADENLDAPDPAEMQALAQAMHPGSNVTIPSTIRDKSQVLPIPGKLK